MLGRERVPYSTTSRVLYQHAEEARGTGIMQCPPSTVWCVVLEGRFLTLRGPGMIVRGRQPSGLGDPRPRGRRCQQKAASATGAWAGSGEA